MLVNRGDPAIAAKIAAEVEALPDAGWILALFASSPERFWVDAEAAGLDVSPVGGDDLPSRCHFKLFRPRVGKERLCAFFYKTSHLAWSRDRFSYGGVEFRPGQVGVTEVSSWLRWLAAGLHPDKRPDRLRRSFLFDVPE